MNVLLLGNKTINITKLPMKIEGSFFLNDPITGKPLLLIESTENGWKAFSSSSAVIVSKNNTIIEQTIIKNGDSYWLKNGDKTYILYSQDSFDNTFKTYKINGEKEIKIGKENMKKIRKIC